MTRPLLQLKNVSKRYGTSSPVLDALSLDIASNDFVAFIGPRGCGKSTLLRLIAGLTPLTGGEILFDGADCGASSTAFSFVFGEAGLLPWRTVERNISLPLQLARVAPTAQKTATAAVMKRWGISHVSRRYPVQLTAGNRRRVALARSMITEPRCILLDEPFAALDAITRNKLSSELMKVREEQPFAVCLVTHSAAEAVYLASRVVVLSPNPGRIREIIEVGEPYPRALEWRESAGFLDVVSQVRAPLNEAQEAT